MLLSLSSRIAGSAGKTVIAPPYSTTYQKGYNNRSHCLRRRV